MTGDAGFGTARAGGCGKPNFVARQRRKSAPSERLSDGEEQREAAIECRAESGMAARAWRAENVIARAAGPLSPRIRSNLKKRRSQAQLRFEPSQLSSAPSVARTSRRRIHPSAFRLIGKASMLALTRAFVICLAFRLALGVACADDASLGGFICARPFVPACADLSATYQNAQNVSACQRDLDRYAAASAAYRDCLERQIASAMRQANDVLDRFRCLSRRNCPPAARSK